MGYCKVQRTRRGVIFTTELARRNRAVRGVTSLVRLCRRSCDRGAMRGVTKLPRPAMRGFVIVAITIINTDEHFLTRVAERRGRMGCVDTSLRCDGCSNRTTFTVPCKVVGTSGRVRSVCGGDYRSSLSRCARLYTLNVSRSSTKCTAPRKLQGMLVVDTAPCR